MKSIKFILTLVGLGLLSNLNAQPIQLTLKDALNYAVQNNEKIKKANYDIGQGKAKTQEVRANALPQINGFGNLTYNPIIGQLVTDMGSFKMGRSWNAQGGLQVDQQLFNQQVFTGLKAARASESYYALNATLTEEEVIETTANNYYQVLLNREQLQVVQQNIKNVKVLEKIIADQYKNGLARKIDVDRLAVNLANLETQQQQLINAVELLEIQLKLSTGMPVETQVVIPQTELKEINTGILAKEAAKNTRTELLILETQESLLGLQKKAYQAEYYPTLALSGNITRTGMSDKFDLFKSDNNSQAFWYSASAVGLTLKVPIFTGFRTKAKVKQADFDILKLQEDIKYTKNALNAAEENARIQLKNSIATFSLQQKNVELAQEIYSSTQNNYNNGLASLTDLLDTESALTQAQNSYNQAILNYKIAEIQLVKSNGNIKSLLN